jgi:hypothetical protein
MIVSSTTKDRQERNTADRERERLTKVARAIREGPAQDFRPFEFRKTLAKKGEITALADYPNRASYPEGEFFTYEFSLVDDEFGPIQELRIIPQGVCHE